MEKKKRKKKIQRTLDKAVIIGNERVEQIVQKVLNDISSGKLSRIPVIEINAKGFELYEEYLRIIESQKDSISELERKYDEVQQDKTLSPGEKLSKKLALKMALMDIYHPNYLKFHKFIDDRYIDIKNELDLNNLEWPRDDGKWIGQFLKDGKPPNEQGYLISLDTESGMDGVLYTDACNICISEQYLGNILGKDYKRLDLASDKKAHLLAPDYNHTSVHDIYEWWLPTLTLKKIQSSDLLDQILVCFTIKRALNGDKDAITKLTEALLISAKSKTTYFYTRRLLSYKLHKVVDKRLAIQENGNRDAIQRRKLDISTMIKLDQDDVENYACALLPVIVAGSQPRAIIENILCDDKKSDLLPFPKWIRQFYLNYIAEYERVEPNPYAMISAKTIWGKSSKSIHSFNGYSFVPGRGYKIGPKSNLYTWTFHKKNGKIYQILKDFYWPTIRDTHPYLSHFSRKIRPRQENPIGLDNHDFSNIVNVLVENGISRRDAEIFFVTVMKKSGEKINISKKASEYGIKHRTDIYRIAQRVRSSPALRNPSVRDALTKILRIKL